MVYDAIIDNETKRLVLEEIILYIFKSNNIEYITGKENIKYDMKIKEILLLK